MSKTVADIMNPKLLYIREGDRVSLARAKIIEFGITAVPVLDAQHRPVGMISLRDLARPDSATFDPACVVTVMRDTEPVEAAARDLAKARLHHAVVVDRDGVAVGMVSAIDFVRALVGLAPEHPEPFDRW